jgi:hypothetical protein
MNFLLNHAKYEIVARVDADDIALPFRYFGVLRRIRKGTIDLSFSHSILFGKGLRFFPFLPQFPFGISSKLAPYFLLLANPFVQSTMIAKKNVLLEAGGYKPSIAEDFELFLRLAGNGSRLERLKRFGVLYRVHQGQLSQQPNFSTNVYQDPFVKRSLQNLEATVGASVPMCTGADLQESLNQFLLSKSLGFRVRMRYLNSLVSFFSQSLNMP